MNSLKISGVQHLRNGVELDYPFVESILSMLEFCDEVVVAADPTSTDTTMHVLNGLQKQYKNIKIVESPWNLDNKERGTELKIQVEKAIENTSNEWIILIEADEVLHEDDALIIKRDIQNAITYGKTGVAFNRLYFYKDPFTVRKDWSHFLIRAFKKGTHIPFQDANSMVSTIQQAPYISEALLYHYSRIGEPKQISMKIRNLEKLYHPDEKLLSYEQLPPYDFKLRNYDTFAKNPENKEVEHPEENLARFEGTHPKIMQPRLMKLSR